MTRDPRVDAYIEAKADFARPILEHLREAVHAACPDAEEAIKWGMPAFLYRGRVLAMMAGFKAHATFSFWRGSEVVGDAAREGAMGQFGPLTCVDDLPPKDELHALIRKAMAVAEEGGARPRAKKRKDSAEVPLDPL